MQTITRPPPCYPLFSSCDKHTNVRPHAHTNTHNICLPITWQYQGQIFRTLYSRSRMAWNVIHSTNLIREWGRAGDLLFSCFITIYGEAKQQLSLSCTDPAQSCTFFKAVASRRAPRKAQHEIWPSYHYFPLNVSRLFSLLLLFTNDPSIHVHINGIYTDIQCKKWKAKMGQKRRGSVGALRPSIHPGDLLNSTYGATDAPAARFVFFCSAELRIYSQFVIDYFV